VITPAPTDPAQLTAQYEALRAQALAGSAAIATPLGLAVLLRRGLAAWLAVCIELVPVVPARDRPRPAGGPAAVAVPIGMHAEAVRVLVSMALAICQKGGS
jgi:hypothetical protein